jgi:aerobic carbon-monoxide dehydrogenase large subunit
VGEAGCIASTPAVVNAVVDALRPLGINDIQMPCTPERVWRAIQSAGSHQADATTDTAQPHFDPGAPNQDPAGTGTPEKGADQ